jgi:hypothetical protein
LNLPFSAYFTKKINQKPSPSQQVYFSPFSLVELVAINLTRSFVLEKIDRVGQVVKI